jgi:hypothetical protein
MKDMAFCGKYEIRSKIILNNKTIAQTSNVGLFVYLVTLYQLYMFNMSAF